MSRALLAIATLFLAGCGLRQPLEPPPGKSLPVTPATASRAPTAEQLLTPPPIARPARVDEVLRQSEEVEEDRFDLPPADVEAPADVADDEEDGPE
ncbi:MAG: LptM family lipoprotein [Sphingosinicella sp.]